MLRSFASITTLAVLAALPACGSQGESADASTDYLGVQPGPEAGGDDGDVGLDATVGATLRLVHLAPDLGAVDYCWRVSGSATFHGPVLGGGVQGGADGGDAEASAPDGGRADAGPDAARDAGADGASLDATLDGPRDAASDAGGDARPEAGLDAAAEGGPGPGDAAPADGSADAGAPMQLLFAQITPGLTVPSGGTFDIALVAPGQPSCAAPKLVAQVTLDAGKSATLAVEGLLGQDAGAPAALSIRAYVDEVSGPSTAGIRFVHAALGWPRGAGPAPTLAVRAGGAVLAPELSPTYSTSLSTTPPVDALGYATVPALGPQTILELDTVGDAAAHTWTTAFAALGALPATAHTGFVVSQPEGALGVVWCDDAPSPGGPSRCALLPAR